MIHLDKKQCLECGTPFDAATSLTGGNTLGPGCMGVCMSCGAVMVFDNHLNVKKPTDEDFERISLNNPDGLAKLMRVSMYIRNKVSYN